MKYAKKKLFIKMLSKLKKARKGGLDMREKRNLGCGSGGGKNRQINHSGSFQSR